MSVILFCLVPSSFVVTYWERADLLALLCVMFSFVLSLSQMVSFGGYGNLIAVTRNTVIHLLPENIRNCETTQENTKI